MTTTRHSRVPCVSGPDSRQDLIGPMRRSLLLLALAASLAGCDTFAPASSPTPTPLLSGIQGVVLLGPMCSAPTAASPCLEAYAALLVVFDTDGQEVAEVTSAADGSFHLALPPGDYVIQPAAGGDPFPRAESQNVTVLDGELTDVEIDYESRDRADDPG